MTEVDGGGDIRTYNKRLLPNTVRDNSLPIMYVQSIMMNSVRMRLLFSAPNSRYCCTSRNPGNRTAATTSTPALFSVVICALVLCYSCCQTLVPPGTGTEDIYVRVCVPVPCTDFVSHWPHRRTGTPCLSERLSVHTCLTGTNTYQVPGTRYQVQGAN